MTADTLTLAAVVATDPDVQAAREAAVTADEAFAAALDVPTHLRLTERTRIARLQDAARAANETADRLARKAHQDARRWLAAGTEA